MKNVQRIYIWHLIHSALLSPPPDRLAAEAALARSLARSRSSLLSGTHLPQLFLFCSRSVERRSSRAGSAVCVPRAHGGRVILTRSRRPGRVCAARWRRKSGSAARERENSRDGRELTLEPATGERRSPDSPVCAECSALVGRRAIESAEYRSEISFIF